MANIRTPPLALVKGFAPASGPFSSRNSLVHPLFGMVGRPSRWGLGFEPIRGRLGAARLSLATGILHQRSRAAENPLGGPIDTDTRVWLHSDQTMNGSAAVIASRPSSVSE
jgi:hypothetical protein